MQQNNNIHKTQFIASILAGVALFISNRALLPEGAFNDGVAAYSYMLITPSVILFLSILAMQYMELVRIWLFLVIGVLVLSSFIVLMGK